MILHYDIPKKRGVNIVKVEITPPDGDFSAVMVGS